LWRIHTHHLWDRVTTEEIGSTKGLYLGLASKNIGRIDGLRRKTTAAAVALVLCFSTFVLFADETWATEQPSQSTHRGTVENTTATNGKGAEPGPRAQIPGETSPLEKPLAQTPLPPTSEKPSADEPSPPPLDPRPSTHQPGPPESQQFAQVISDEEVGVSDPVLNTHTRPAPDRSVVPVEDTGWSSSVPGSSYQAEPPVSAAEDSPLPIDQASEPVLGLAVSDWADSEYTSLLPNPTVFEDASLLGTTRGAEPTILPKSSTPAPTGPVSAGGASRLPSSLGTTALAAVGTAMDTVQSAVANAATGALGTLSGGSPEPPSSGVQEEKPSDGGGGSPQPTAPPIAAPMWGSSFGLSGGGGHMSGGGLPLLLGVLVLAAILLRRDFRTYLVSCEMPKPSSVLLLPLERPG
jgi:hypothetical protein